MSLFFLTQLKFQFLMLLLDPIATFLFSILVLFTTIRLLRDSLGVLMESVPRGIRLSEVLCLICVCLRSI